MTNCPHLNNGTCSLSAILAKREMFLTLTCPTTELQCKRCQSAGEATVDKPTLQVLGNVLMACPRKHKKRWEAFCNYVQTGTPRGLGDRVEKVLKKTGVAGAVKGIAKAFGVSDCGCSGRRNRMNDAFPSQSSQSSSAAAHENPG